MTDLDTLYAGCTAFVLQWTGENETPRGVVDLLVMAAQDYDSYTEEGNYSRAELDLEASSTYVQCDLSSDEIEEYVGMFEDFLCQASDGVFDDFDWEEATFSEEDEVA